MKKIIIISFLFLIVLPAEAQESIRYFLEIPDSQYVPKIVSNKNGKVVLEVNSKLKNAAQINKVFKTYNIYGFYDYFKGTNKATLKNKYIIDLGESDNLEQLTKRFPFYYPSYEKEIVYPSLMENQPMSFTPNDFENPDLLNEINIHNYDDYAQRELTMIRAKEAWSITKGKPYVIIGIADLGFDVEGFNNDPDNPGHEDLASEFVGGLPNYNTINFNNPVGQHGNWVAGFASAATDNGVGVASIGFNTRMIGARGTQVSNLVALANFNPKPKVLNLSAGTESSGGNQGTQDMIDMIRDLDVTLVVAGGNGLGSGPSEDGYYYPASYKNVIAVSTVGNKNEIGSTFLPFDNWKDVHKAFNNSPNVQEVRTHQHNDSIDIVVPAYYPSPRVKTDINHDDPWKDDYRPTGWGGTSLSAPVVAGTIGLMHSVNYCIKPNEVETILKLTAVVVDTIPENLEFYGQLGAGRLDAYEAVKMAKDMADDFGVVEVKNRILYRPWFYKLATAPYKINMFNNEIHKGSKIKFRARNSIEITETLMEPTTGYVDLQIDATLALDCDIPPHFDTSGRTNIENSSNSEGNETEYIVFPTLVKNELNVKNISKGNRISKIEIFDFAGNTVFSTSKIENQETQIKTTQLLPGIYIIKGYGETEEEIFTSKFVKQ